MEILGLKVRGSEFEVQIFPGKFKLGNLKFLFNNNKKKLFGRFRFRLGLIYLKILGQNIEIINIGCSIDENREIQNFLNE